jgi:serine protease SohB
MIDALIQFGLFFAETIILVAAILIIAAGIMAIAGKGKLKEKRKITIKKLNTYYEELKEKINDEILNKTERKKLAKEKKKSKKVEKKQKDKKEKRIFVIEFKGDIKASGVDSLCEEVSAILTVATPKDEVIVRLESAGGVVHGYGLAASQLQRIKDKSIPLIVCVDKVAASGGYMMACIADKILAAPFAIIGSIGVIAQIPNFNRLLKKHNIDFEQITAGEYKRTLTLFGENTRKGRQKFQEEINDVHDLFKGFVKDHRPQIDIDKLATGEHWFAKKAIELNLVDEIKTSDDYLMQALGSSNLYAIKLHKKKSLIEKMTTSAQAMFSKFVAKQNTEQLYY